MSREAPRSERWLHRVPYALLEHPFACLMAAWGAISGTAVLTGFTRPDSLAALLPKPLLTVWAALVLLSSLSITWGLVTRRYSTATARGLQLLGAVCAAYAVAILGVAGWRNGIPAGSLLMVIAALCYLRGWFLRTQGEIHRRARMVAAGVEQEMTRRDRP